MGGCFLALGLFGVTAVLLLHHAYPNKSGSLVKAIASVSDSAVGEVDAWDMVQSMAGKPWPEVRKQLADQGIYKMYPFSSGKFQVHHMAVRREQDSPLEHYWLILATSATA